MYSSGYSYKYPIIYLFTYMYIYTLLKLTNPFITNPIFTNSQLRYNFQS